MNSITNVFSHISFGFSCTSYVRHKKNWSWNVTQWQGTCLAYTRHWPQYIAPQKKKKKAKRYSNVNE
jgi:hypothetical protein